MGCREFTYLFLWEKTPEDRNNIASSSAQYPVLSTQHQPLPGQVPCPQQIFREFCSVSAHFYNRVLILDSSFIKKSSLQSYHLWMGCHCKFSCM